MRILKFIVDKQIIKQDPNCDFDNLIPGSEGYLQAEFSFSREWDDCIKVAAFYSPMGREFTPQVLKSNNTCIIPTEALAISEFKIRILGKRENFKITTNKITVLQKGCVK